jgi:hypothetical protein
LINFKEFFNLIKKKKKITANIEKKIIKFKNFIKSVINSESFGSKYNVYFNLFTLIKLVKNIPQKVGNIIL